MASRRARVKVAPKLTVGRNRTTVNTETRGKAAEAVEGFDASNSKVIKQSSKEYIKTKDSEPIVRSEVVGDTVAIKTVDESFSKSVEPKITNNAPEADTATNVLKEYISGDGKRENLPSKTVELVVEESIDTEPIVSAVLDNEARVNIAEVLPNISTVGDEDVTKAADASVEVSAAIVSASEVPPATIDSDWEDEEFTYNQLETIPPELTDLINKATAETVVEKDRNENLTTSVSPITTTSLPVTPRMRLPGGKNKFKPNLFSDRRSRNSSGSRHPVVLSPRVRTVSGSGTDSDSEMVGTGSRTRASLLKPPSSAPLLEGLLQKQPQRIRRITETSKGEKERSQFMKRKQEHKRRFMRGVPERGNMTMFDLIYYNPENGPRMSIEEEEEPQQLEKVTNDDTDITDTVAPDTVVDAEPDSPPKTPPPPVPRVIVVNGEIILDDSSLVLETTEAKKAKNFLENAPVAVVENSKTNSTNYGTWSKKRKHVDWSEKETLRFYRALSVVGSDFSMMESVFKQTRTRQELKLKFKKEEKMNGKMVDKCLKERGMYTELEGIMEDSEEDSDEEKQQDYDQERRGRKKLAKKRPRGRYKNKGFYDSSSGGEEADNETSRSPARKKPLGGTRSKRKVGSEELIPGVQHSDDQVATSLPATPLLATTSTTVRGVQFPPGLLAANPGLMGARPGSLVVVASPNKTDPGSRLLHVYMVSDKQKAKVDGSVQDRSKSPRISAGNSSRSLSPRVTLDPAVVRAVDRTRLAGREARLGRSRALSESENSSKGRVQSAFESEDQRQSSQISTPASTQRQRTYSEGSGNLRMDVVRENFLSGPSKSLPSTSSSSAISLGCINTSSTSTLTVSTPNIIINSTTTSTHPIARKPKSVGGKNTNRSS